MTLTNAFHELIANNPAWHKLTTMTKEESIIFVGSFSESASNTADHSKVRKILSDAGYLSTETWSKHFGPEVTTAAPKQGIVVSDPTKD